MRGIDYEMRAPGMGGRDGDGAGVLGRDLPAGRKRQIVVLAAHRRRVLARGVEGGISPLALEN